MIILKRDQVGEGEEKVTIIQGTSEEVSIWYNIALIPTHLQNDQSLDQDKEGEEQRKEGVEGVEEETEGIFS